MCYAKKKAAIFLKIYLSLEKKIIVISHFNLKIKIYQISYYVISLSRPKDSNNQSFKFKKITRKTKIVRMKSWDIFHKFKKFEKF